MDVAWTNASVQALAALPDLKMLTLWNAAINDGCARELAWHSKLVELDLTNDRGITGKGVLELGALTNLKTLSLSTTGLTDESMPAIAKLSRLEKLNLLSTMITNGGLKHVAALKNLKNLVPGNTRIHDAGLKYLEGLSELRELDVFGFPAISKQAADALKKKLPRLEIQGVR